MMISSIISFVTLTSGLIFVLYHINTDPSYHFNESLKRSLINPAEAHLRAANEIIVFLLFCGLMSVSLLVTSKSKVESDRSRGQIFMNILEEYESFKAATRFSEEEAQSVWESRRLTQMREDETDARDPEEVYETDDSFSIQLFRILFEFDPRDVTVVENRS